MKTASTAKRTTDDTAPVGEVTDGIAEVYDQILQLVASSTLPPSEMVYLLRMVGDLGEYDLKLYLGLPAT